MFDTDGIGTENERTNTEKGRVIFEKLMITHLLNKFIIVFTRSHLWFISGVNTILSYALQDLC